jgi:drug/metabolite transporter (DMT)-like permease
LTLEDPTATVARVSESRWRRDAWLGYVLVAAAAASWGAQSVVAKRLLTGGLPAGLLVSARTTLAGAAVLAVLAVTRPALLRVTPRALGRIVLLGTLGMALSNYAYYSTLARIPVATAVLVLYTAPLFVLAAGIFLGEPPRRRDVLAAAVTLAGAALVVGAWSPATVALDRVGIALGLSSALAYAFYNLWAKTLPPGLSPWTVLVYSFAAAALFWLPLAPPWKLVGLAHGQGVWLGVGVVTIFGTLLPFALSLAGLRRISAAHASVTSSLEPLVAAVAAFVVLGETLTPGQVAGGVLIVAGITLLHVRARQASTA